MDRRTFVKSAVACSLGAGSCRLFGQSSQEVLRGKVVSEGRPLVGVRCSDGKHVVLTGDDGRFAIRSTGHGGTFVFVVVPQGYWTDRFYVRTAEALATEVVFDLKPTGPAERYTAVYMPDIHLGEGNKTLSYERFGNTIREINALRHPPAFVLAGGDIGLQQKQAKPYLDIMATLKVPVRHAIGDRDLFVREIDPRKRFNDQWGPSYYSFDYGHVHYVVLDGCRADPSGQGFKGVVGQVSPTELEWLEHDLERVPKGMPTIVTTHIPLMSTYPQRRGTHAKRSPWWVIQNAREVIQLLSQFDVPLVLQGHLHENERIFDQSIEFAGTVAVCGSRWQAPAGIERGASGEPRGYRLVEVNGTRITHRYVSSAESRAQQAGEFVGLAGDRVLDVNGLVVNFFDASDQAKIFGRMDGGQSIPWLPARVPGPDSDVMAAHHWRCPPHLMSPGKHKVEVRCVDRGQPDIVLSQTVQIGND